MPLVIPDGFAQITFNFETTAGTGPFATTIGVAQNDLEASLTDYANSAFEAYAEAMMPFTHNILTLQNATATIQLPDGGYGSVPSDLDPVLGTKAGTAESVGMSLLVRKQTASLGRRGRGRMFMPGCLGANDVQSSGTLFPAAQEAFQGAVDDFYDRLTTAGDGTIALNPYLLHNDAVVNPTAITSLQVGTVMGMLRKRVR